MAEDGKGKGGGFLKEEFAGIPGWIWLTGAAVVVLGYLYLRHQSNASQGSADQQQSSQQGRQPAAQVTLIPFQTMTRTWMHDHQKSPHPSKTKNTNAPGNPSGPVVGG